MKDKNPCGRSAALDPDKLIWLLLLLLLAERVLVFFELGPTYVSGADDVNYVPSGIQFAKSGMISYGAPVPSALIMPGMPVLLGLLSLLFGEGWGLWAAARFCWMLIGTATAYFMYQTVRQIVSPWCGLLAAAAFALPNIAWMNNVVLTETPYMFFLVLCVYFTLKMERSRDRKYFVCYLAAFMLGLMFKANLITMPLFSGLYLLFRRCDRKLLLRRALALSGVLLLFLIPWSIRNYLQFDAFIPLTYGAGNPTLLGTYQGEGYPADEDLDYETNVEAVLREKYARYYRPEPQPYVREELGEMEGYLMLYDPKGEVAKPHQAQYFAFQRDAIKAAYRMRVWFREDPVGFLKSYLLIKPRWMLNWAWAWEEVLHVSYDTLHRISQLNFLFCGLTVLLALLLKKGRAPVAFMGFVYFAYLYISAMAFVTDRYGAVLMPLRYMIAAIGFGLLWDAFQLLRQKKQRKDRPLAEK